MESQELTKLSVSRLKALAQEHGVSLEGCLEKQHLVAALQAAGVTPAKEESGQAAAAANPATSAPDAGSSDRADLKRRVFAFWDADSDGFLRQDEMLQVARCVGFDGTEEEWAEEFVQVCGDHKCSPSQGMSASAIMALLDDKSETGCFLSDAALQRVLASANSAPRAAQAPQGSPGPSRDELKRRVFRLWDEDRDGCLKEPEMLKLARCVGFEGPDADFSEEYAQMCEQRGCAPADGLSEATVMALLDDESDTGCFVSTEELQQIAGATAAPAAAAAEAPKAPPRTVPKPGAGGKVQLDRGGLKRRAFLMWDADGDGRLNVGEMLQLAKCLGFDGTEEEWAEQYREMCSQHSCTPGDGVPQETVLTMLDDESDSGCFISTEELAQILRGAGTAPGAAAAAPAQAAPAAPAMAAAKRPPPVA